VFSPGNKARVLATEMLKARDQLEYVPLLLSGLAMPIESSFNVATDSEGSVHYSHALYREGPMSDWSYDIRKTVHQQNFNTNSTLLDTYTGETSIGPPSESPIVVAAKKAVVANAAQGRYGNTASATESQVARANEATEELNSRIIPVLAGTTGKDFGDNPKAWWDWWRNQNEYYTSDHPLDQHYNTQTDHINYGQPRTSTYSTAPPPPPRPPGFHSCFAKGTLVWTKTGLKEIETLESGDLVLAQNVDTGEIKYEPVLTRTNRPAGPIVKVSTNGGDVYATTGHPFWVAGLGWRMPKELQHDAVLHCLTGATRVESVEPSTEAEAYNLVVAELNTYFVGEKGFLVHDITPRGPTQTVLPGVTAKELASARAE
jgi:hypothetical protein